MKVLVLSDSHGRDENVRKALEIEKPIDALIHLGDSQEEEEEFRLCVGQDEVELYMVKGNCDYFADLPASRVISLEGHRILMAHGHGYYVNFGIRDLVADAKANNCEIAMYGHTHRPDIDESDSDVLVLNPGSISYPRQYGKEPSYMVLNLRKGKAVTCELKYL